MKELREHEFVKLVALINAHTAKGQVPDRMMIDPLVVGQFAYQFLGPCVYLMLARERGSSTRYLKIGLAKNVKTRLGEIKVGCPLEIERAMYFCCRTYGRARGLERLLQNACSDHRVQGEWFMFKDAAELSVALKMLCDAADESLGDMQNSFVYQINNCGGQQDQQSIHDFLTVLMYEACADGPGGLSRLQSAELRGAATRLAKQAAA